jgi:hypothetical protein
MGRKTIVTLIVTGALAAVATVGAFTYKSVYAQEATPTAPSDSTGQTRQYRGMRVDMAGAGGQDLADALGIDLATLQAAQQTAAQEALKQAVEQGLITQAQADQMQANGLGGHRMGGLGRFNTGTIDMHALLADALGISVDELTAAHQQAFETGLTEAVASGKITQEQADLMLARKAVFGSEKFQASMQSAYQSAVQQAVTDGVITQAQADQILAENNGRGFGFGGGMNGMKGMGGHGRGGPRGGGN